VSIIAKALNNNTTLEQLFFRRYRFGDKGVQSLAQTLSLNNSRIVILDLQSNGITDEGAGYLAEMLKTNKNLQRLLLGGNEISDRGVQHLANVITHHNTTLVSLLVRGHTLVSDLSVDALVEMLKHHQTLNWLDIQECNLSEKGKERLRQVVKSKKGFTLEL
jgi:Ran GTPase-activating protein (RanGAP) involved in mRNA processing and transport